MTSQTKLVQTSTEIKVIFLGRSLLRQYECKIAILEGLSGRAFCHPVSDCRGFLFVTENEGKIKKSTKTKVKTVNVNPHKIQSITNPNIKSIQCYQTGLFQSESPRYRESPKYRSWLPVHHCHFWQMREIESEVDSLSWCSNFSNDQMIRFLCWSNVWIALLIKFLQLFLTFTTTLTDNSHISRASKSVLSPHGKFSECTKHGAQAIRAWIGRPGCPWCPCPVVEISLLIKYLLGSGDTVYPSTATTCCLRPPHRLKGTNALFWFNKQAS